MVRIANITADCYAHPNEIVNFRVAVFVQPSLSRNAATYWFQSAQIWKPYPLLTKICSMDYSAPAIESENNLFIAMPSKFTVTMAVTKVKMD